jgi:hypothetical protein
MEAEEDASLHMSSSSAKRLIQKTLLPFELGADGVRKIELQPALQVSEDIGELKRE